MPAGSPAQLRLLDRLTRRVRCREFYPAEASPPFTTLPMLRRGNLAIHPEFGAGLAVGERYFEMDSWIWPGLKPDQAYLGSSGPRPGDYLEVYLDAFQKLINCPVVRLMQCYNNEAECIESLPTIPPLLEQIIKAPRSETADGRRLVIIDIQTFVTAILPYGARPPRVEMPELSVAYEKLMREVCAMMDRSQLNDIQLYQANLPSLWMYYSRSRTPTTANLIIAQNYGSSWQVYAQILQSDTRIRNETMPALRCLWPPSNR
ncbi:unnamed protein product, partial [Mesorhabditis spiculigera]